MWNIFKKTKNLKTDLLSFKNEPLSSLSVILLIILDLFIFANVIYGIMGETIKSPKPHNYFPSHCTKHFDIPKASYETFDRSISYNIKLYKKAQSPYCSQLQEKITAFTITSLYKERLRSIRKIEDQLRQNDRRLTQISQSYNTRLFEQIANMPNNKALRDAKSEYDSLHADNAKLQAQKAAIPSVTTLSGYDAYEQYVTKNKTAFYEAKDSYTFWQPFNEFGRVLTFILPLLLISGFFYYRSKKRELRSEHYNPIIKIISSHLSLILILPLVWYTLHLVYHVIPKTLLKQVIDYLIAIGLLSILNYVVIFVVILIFGLLIYWIQKRTVANKKIGAQKNIKKVISFSKCPGCDYKVDFNKPFCPYCGKKLLDECALCHQATIIDLPYCQHCGVKKVIE